MEFWDVVRSRRSVRHFRPDPVPVDKLQRLMAAATLAPSAQNAQPWRYHVVQGDPRKHIGAIISGATVHLQEYMEQLGPKHYEDAVHWYSSLGDAPVVIAVSMKKPDSELDELNKLLSVGASIENVLLAATDEGLGACNVTFTSWVRDDLSEFLGLAVGSLVVAVIAVGFAGDVPSARPEHNPDVVKWIG